MKKLLVLAICMACIGCFVVQAQDQATESKIKPAEETRIEKKDKENASAMRSGIQVHGHWIIEILDKDGKSVSLNEFDNDLQMSKALSHMLGLGGSQYGSYGGWLVMLKGTPQPCGVNGCLVSTSANSCSNSSSMDPHSTNLTKTLRATGDPWWWDIVLSGSVVFDQNSSLDHVYTMVKICNDTILPSGCATADYPDCFFENLTEKQLTTPIPIQAGQQVLVTVEISFS